MVKKLKFFLITALVIGMATSGMATGALAGEIPKTLKVAAIFGAGVENAWTRAWIQSFDRVKAQKPFGVEMSLDYTENVYGDKALSVLEAYAESKYDIIWFHSSATDEIESIRDDYPDTLFVVTGSGNRAIGGNLYMLYAHMHEPSYLLGIIAGSMTKSNVIGVVGLFPADDVNDQIHAFRDGAKSVNLSVKMKVTFIESWYDPAKASEAANAQIAAGADYILQLGESFETCKEKEIICFGNYVDLNSVAPTVVMTSTVTHWDPQLMYVINEWKNHQVDATAYNAPMKKVWYSMSQGGADIAPYHDFAAKIPEDVKARVKKVKEDIISGKFKVEMNMTLPKSD